MKTMMLLTPTRPSTKTPTVWWLSFCMSMLISTAASAYPLDGYETTGIPRLQAMRLMQEGELPGRKRPPGELLPLAMVDLRLLDAPDFTLPATDPGLTRRLKSLLGRYANRYGIALLDLSDPQQPRYAEWRGEVHQNPGSVGKLMVALALFQALADLYPDDIDARIRVLRETIITADIFSVHDHHTVPFWDGERRRYYRHPIRIGDQGSLYTYLDWMLSPSSNSAGAMVQKQLILLARYGHDYPVSETESARFFKETPRQELGRIFAKAIQEPITRNGLDLATLRQGSFLTHKGKRLVPGTSSHATPRSLLQFSVKMEQGKLVDEWSSRELKRLLYVTERRIRYASSGALRQSAVYFKSGSLYSCVKEPGFVCRKYHGNKRNFMNSVAIVESPAGQNRLFYMVAVLSNVLRKNSAQDHRDLARAIHGMLLRDHPAAPVPAGELPPSATFGEGFIGYTSERQAVKLAIDTQEALLDLGYDIGDIDGVIGPKSRKAIREFQKTEGLSVTGSPSPALLKRLRQVAEAQGRARPAGDAGASTAD